MKYSPVVTTKIVHTLSKKQTEKVHSPLWSYPNMNKEMKSSNR